MLANWDIRLFLILKSGTPHKYSSQRSKIAVGQGRYTYLPTHPLGQDMTQGQFLSGV